MTITKILLVDDEEFNLQLLIYALESMEKTEFIKSYSAKEALEIIQSTNIDLIISDISMPNMNGLEMLQQLKADDKTKYIPVIMVTAKDEEKYRALEFGSEDFLTKPIDPIELKFKVRNLLKLKKYSDLQLHFNELLESEIKKKEESLKHFASMEQELKVSKQIQESLLPKAYPTKGGLDIYGRCTQTHDVGGDFFDIFETECGNYTVFIIADVSGHGLVSSLIAMQLRTLVRSELRSATDSLTHRLYSINNILVENIDNSSMFVTALFLRFHHESGIIESINAGHHNPLGNIKMKHQSGIPLGILPNAEYQTLSTQLNDGDSILLYTDGILECEDKEGVMYENYFYKDIDNTIHLNSKAKVETILKNFYDYIHEQVDDVTILSISK